MLLNKEIREIVAREIDSLGYVLWGIEVVPTRYSYLVRVYIDKANGVGVDDCELVNRHLDMCLKKEKYLFEISSPGLARKFFDVKQYKAYVGENIKVRMRYNKDGQKNLSGQLIEVTDNSLSLQVADETINIAFDHIEKGQLQPNYNGIFKQ